MACNLHGTVAQDVFGAFEWICLNGRKNTCKAHAKIDVGYKHPLVTRWHSCGGYASKIVRGTRINLHREVVQAPVELHVDHINGNILDNRRSNLRAVIPRFNAHNRIGRGADSRYKGCFRSGGKGLWRVCAGGFASEEDAARAFDLLNRLTKGDNATYNFPEVGERSAITGEIRLV